MFSLSYKCEAVLPTRCAGEMPLGYATSESVCRVVNKRTFGSSESASSLQRCLFFSDNSANEKSDSQSIVYCLEEQESGETLISQSLSLSTKGLLGI
jgi:hypothetical protein